MQKRKNIPTLKKELLILQSRWVKLYYSKGERYVNCYTCDKPIQVNTYFCQCGHCFSKSGYPALQLLVEQQRPQCDVCNVTLNGNEDVFKERLKAEIGEERFAWLDSHKNDTLKLDRTELEKQIFVFKEKIRNLEQDF